jgi:hypothetical protein
MATQPQRRPSRQELAEQARRIEMFGLLAVERAARMYAEFTHGNLAGPAYRAREEARDRLLDALSQLDSARNY